MKPAIPLILEQLNPPYHSSHIFAKKSHSNRQKSFGTLTPKNPRKIIMPLEKQVFFTCDQPQSGDFQVIFVLWSKMEVSLRQFSVSSSKVLKQTFFM